MLYALALATGRSTSSSGRSCNSAGSFSRRLAKVLRSFWVYRNRSELLRVRLEYWISFWRVMTSARLRGKAPRAFHRTVWSICPLVLLSPIFVVHLTRSASRAARDSCRRRDSPHPKGARTLNVHVQWRALACQKRWSLIRFVTIPRFLRAQLATDSMPDRGSIDRSSRLRREHDRDGSDDEDRSHHHHQAVGRQHQALAIDEVVEHFAAQLWIDPWRRQARRAAADDEVRQLGMGSDAAVLPRRRDERGGKRSG